MSTDGLYHKFNVSRTDGNGKNSKDKHHGCRYFVLDVTHDPYALTALNAYIGVCAEEYPQLASDLVKLISQETP